MTCTHCHRAYEPSIWEKVDLELCPECLKLFLEITDDRPESGQDV